MNFITTMYVPNLIVLANYADLSFKGLINNFPILFVTASDMRKMSL